MSKPAARHVLRGHLVALAIPVGDEPPAEFRIFVAGANESEKGTFLFDEPAARAVISAQAAWGVDRMIDLEHLSLDPEARHYDPDARGWCQLEVREDGSLWAINVRWCEDGERRLRAKTQRYISPFFRFDADNRVVKIVNIAITALPATHNTPALVAASARFGDEPMPTAPHKPGRDCRLTTGIAFDDVRRAISAALGDRYPSPEGQFPDGPWVQDVFDASVVYELDGKLFEVSYTFNGSTAILGTTPTEVRRSYTPVTPITPAAAPSAAPAATSTSTAKGAATMALDPKIQAVIDACTACASACRACADACDACAKICATGTPEECAAACVTCLAACETCMAACDACMTACAAVAQPAAGTPSMPAAAAVLSLTGEKSVAQALSVLATWRDNAAALKTKLEAAVAETAKLTAKATDAEAASLIDAAARARKVLPANRAAVEAVYKNHGLSALKATLGALVPAIDAGAPARESAEAPQREGGSAATVTGGSGTPLTVDNKTYEQFSANERAQLRQREGGETTYQQLRADWIQRGKPLAPKAA